MTLSASIADEVKLKTGETITGRIIYEADDIIRIEVPVTASIKETKVIGRGDIESIVKEAPDSVEFSRIQKFLPTGSLLPASTYRQLLETGPDSFLKAFPTSLHVPKVTEIRKTLAEELDKVERGFIKLEGEWISPEDKIAFKELIDSKVRFLKMESYAKSRNYNDLINALREFEVLEETYFGSPAFPKAVELVKEVIPNLGRQLQTMARDVDYQNAEYQRSLEASTPDARLQVTAARDREEKAFQNSVTADKKAGLKWVQLNPRIKSSIEAYLKLASAELARLRELDVALLTTQAEELVEVDKLIALNNIAAAQTKLNEAAAITGQKTTSKSKASKSSKSKSGGKSGSYISILAAKISDRIADEKAKEAARVAASASEKLTANLKKADSRVEPGETDPATVEGVDAEGAPTPGANPAVPESEIDEFAALAGSKKSPAKVTDEKKSPSKKKSKTAGEDDEDSDNTDRSAAVAEEGGGFPMGLIVPILTALLILTVVAMKVFGIGGKKEE